MKVKGRVFDCEFCSSRIPVYLDAFDLRFPFCSDTRIAIPCHKIFEWDIEQSIITHKSHLTIGNKSF